MKRILIGIFLVLLGLVAGFILAKKMSSSDNYPAHIVTEEFRSQFNENG